MEIGDVITREALIKDNWTKEKENSKSGIEIWNRGSQRILWRVKNSKVYLIWDNKLKFT